MTRSWITSQPNRRAGALLIADEVITGFRLRYGASPAAARLRPDLVTLGKIIGGGMPIGAVAGRAQLLEQLAPVGPSTRPAP